VPDRILDLNANVGLPRYAPGDFSSR